MNIQSDWSRFYREINVQLKSRLEILYPNSHFATEIFRRIAKGRKIRSLLFSKMARSLDWGLEESVIADVCLTIELSHAASVLVDDILDGDDTRHGYTSSNVALGTPIAALEAHFLCAEALKLCSRYPKLLNSLVEAYSATATGELYDVFGVEPLEAWISEGYGEIVFQKTSSLFRYALTAATALTNRSDLQRTFSDIGRAFGKFYQLSNDYYDLQISNLRKRHSNTDVWRITYSFPLALYIERFGPADFLPQIKKKMLSYEEWQHLLERLWRPEIRDEARQELHSSCEDVIRLVGNARFPIEVRDHFEALVRWISEEDFWYHSMDAKSEERGSPEELLTAV